MAIPEKILKKVEKPARYTGGEWGQTIKDKRISISVLPSAFPIHTR